MIASPPPSTMPMAIAISGSSIVTRSPLMMRASNRYSPTTPHSKFAFVTTERPSATAITRMTAAATQRPGRRTGTAVMSSGRPAVCGIGSEDTRCYSFSSSAARAIDRGGRQRSGLQAPFGEDLRIRAVGDQRLQRRLDRLGQPAALRNREAIRSGFVLFSHYFLDPGFLLCLFV